MLGHWSTFGRLVVVLAISAPTAWGVEFVVGDQSATARPGGRMQSALPRPPSGRVAPSSMVGGVRPPTRNVDYPDPSVEIAPSRRSSIQSQTLNSTQTRNMASGTAPSAPARTARRQTTIVPGSPAGTGVMASPEGGNIEPVPLEPSPVTTDNNWAWDETSTSYGGDFMEEAAAGACGDTCGDGSNWNDKNSEYGCRRGPWFADLWIAQGFTSNYDRPSNKFNYPLTFNDRANEYQMNQLYASLGRRVKDCGDCWDLGGRVDVLYGTDYFFTTAAGLETHEDGSQKWNSSDGPRAGGNAALYGVALPQAYAEVYVPWATGISVKLGHFYTPLGYESVMAPENFFYSHCYTMQYGEPFTHTGALAQIPMGESFGGFFGYTQGWDNWEDLNNQPGFLGGFSWNPDSTSSVSFAMHTGDEDPAGLNNRTVYSVVLTNQLTDRLRYVFQHDFGVQANAELDAQGEPDSAKWYGLNQYFFYDVNPCVTLGTRLEWFRDQDNFRVLGIPDEARVTGGNYFEMSFGANCRFARRWVVRPEIRYDWSDVVPPGGGGMYDTFSDDDQFTLATDLIFRF